MLINESNRNEWLKKLKDFKGKLSNYQDLVRPLAPEWIIPIKEGPLRKLRILRDELQVIYGGLKEVIREVIKEQGGNYSISHMNELHDVFELALSDLSFENCKPTNLTLEALGKAILLVNQTIGKIGAELKSEQLTSEAIYPSGKPYEAYKHIREIITNVAKELTIVDTYVDGTLFILLENVRSGVQIKILTLSMKGDFELAGQKFKEQRESAKEGTLEVRKSVEIHDRFIIADNRFFHLGHSLKDVGEKKMSAVSEFEGSLIKTKLREEVSRCWDEAKIVLQSGS